MYLTRQLIDAAEFVKPQKDFISGASVLFFGVVRDHSEGRKVRYLEYEAYEMMAQKIFESLVQEVLRMWPVESVQVRHRLGRIELGEIAVAIQIASAHRDEAYKASRFLIEGIKHRVPIWKREFFTDGSTQWGRCTHAGAAEKVREAC